MSAFDPKRTSGLMGKRGWLYDVSPPPPGRRVLGFLLKIWAVKFPSVGDHGYERPVADGISIGRLLC
jgi:hypothetical protein